jgi:hypothetical protein
VKDIPVENSSEAGRSPQASVDAPADADGEKILFEALNETLAAKSDRIVKKLGEQAEAGNNTSAKLLLDILILRGQKGKRVKKRLQELIGKIENPSEWINPETHDPERNKESSS